MYIIRIAVYSVFTMTVYAGLITFLVTLAMRPVKPQATYNVLFVVMIGVGVKPNPAFMNNFPELFAHYNL